MVKSLISILVIAAMAIFSVPQYASAATIDSGGWGTAVTIAIGTFSGGTTKPDTAQTFTPSSGIRMAFNVSTDYNSYNIVAQHSGGDKAYGLHSNGGRMSYHAETAGTFTTSGPSSASSDPTTDFPTATWTGM